MDNPKSKKIAHLICNAHLDPIWQWEWEEGAAAALATFYSAADLAHEFDYIFCHNEVTLYKYIEEYAPDLFARIKALIKAGRWHIMGGWYLQPDCNMPTGESFVRQIRVGERYFREKFGVKSETAICFDAFGHTRGLVQIVKKCGQKNYLLCRTGNDPIPALQFWWEGLDGSCIKANAAVHAYNTPMGGAADSLRWKVSGQDYDTVCALWGVGNHGGGPSRGDLADIRAMMEEADRGEDVRYLHSTPDAFFREIEPTAVHKASLRTVMPGCYTTMVRIKQKHAALENALYETETLCAVAALRGLIEYPEAELDIVTEDLLNAQFHDILPGSGIRAAEENGLQLLDHGLLTVNRLRARAYFAMTAGGERSREGEYPVYVYNPHPYPWETDVTCEMMLSDQNWSEDTVFTPYVYDASGTRLPSQNVKEESNLSLDWRKRILFRGTLAPLTVTRFSVYMKTEPKPEARTDTDSGPIVIDLPEIEKHVEIDRKTGLLCAYRIHGREYLTGDGAGRLYLYEDNADPWAMSGFQLNGMGRSPKPFVLESTPGGPFSHMQSVQITEDGEICTCAEAFFVCDNTRARVHYTVYKHDPAVDISVDVFAGDANRMVKLSVPTGQTGAYIGETAFGVEELYGDGRECVAQRFVALRGAEENEPCLALLNRGTYGSSAQNGEILMSLVRTASYAAHPIGERPLIPTSKYVKKIDMGERSFSFRLIADREEALPAHALRFNHPPYACNVFPHETKREERPFSLTISDGDIALVTMKKEWGGDDELIRLHNGTCRQKEVTVSVNGVSISLSFVSYEAKTLRLTPDGVLTEEAELLI